MKYYCRKGYGRLLLLVVSFLPIFAFSQVTLKGKIVEENGKTVPFVNVIEKGTANGAVANIEGHFSIQVKSLPTILTFSSLGYKTVEYKVESIAPITITMSVSAQALDEVVITGLASSVKRSNLANAVASVSAKELVGITDPPSIGSALYGKLTGVTITSSSGAPGGGMSIKLRGATSIFGNTQPLYIIDGVYLDNSSIPAGLNVVSQASGQGSTSNQDNPSSRIADINPQDIASIEILKGASAAAIYGSRAAAGVVIITTKRGKAGETKFRFSQSLGWSEVTHLLGQRDYTEDRVLNTFGPAALAEYIKARDENRLIDYEKEIFGEKGALSITSFTISGGGDKTQFYAGVTHNNEKGIVKHTGYEKTSLRLNLDHQPTDFIDLKLSTNYISSSSDRGFFNNDNTGTSIGVALTAVTPWLQLFPDENGIYPDNPSGASNPLQTRDLITNNEQVNRFIMGGTATIDVYEADHSNLELILRGGLDIYQLQTQVIFPKELQFMKPSNGGVNGVAVLGEVQNKNYNLSAFLVHNYFTNSGLSFRTQLGLTSAHFDQNRLITTASGLVASETNVDQAANVGVNQFRLLQEDFGFFVQEEFNYQDKFIATIGLRADKSSNNGDANKFFYFPKASLAVNVNEFGFWNSSSTWNQFKLRVAYGEAGNFPPFGALFTSYAAASTDGILGISLVGTRGNPNLKSERQKELEFGTDIGFFKGRVSFSATYYIKTVEDLILQAAIEPSSGFTSQFVNAGALENRGIELALNTTPIQTNNFRWDFGVNFFKNESKITELGVPAFNIGAFGAVLGTFRIEEGESATQIVGFGPNPGADGFQNFGDAAPDFQMAFDNYIKYKNFELSFLFQWKKGGDNINLTTLLTDLNGTSYDYNDFGLDPSGQLANGPYRVSQLGVSSDVFVQDASYVRLREVGLYYTFTKKMLSEILGGNLDSVKIGMSGSNLLNFFDYNGYDPEVSNFGSNGIFTGVDVTPFPSSKRYLFNLTANF